MSKLKKVFNPQEHTLSVCIVIVCDGKILLLKRSPESPKFPRAWSLPGGKFDKDLDINLTDTAIRETLEETSFNTSGYIKDVDDKTYWDSENQFAISFITILIKDFPFIKLSKEHVDYMWCPLELVLNVLTDDVPTSRQFFKNNLSLLLEKSK